MKNLLFPPFFILLLLSSCKSDPKPARPAGGKQSDNYKIPSENSIAKNSPAKQSPGKKIYTNFCMQCHLPKGQGVPNIYPPLAGSNWLSEKRTASIHAVKYGLEGEIKVNGKTYNNVMLPLGLTDQEIADVMNYIMTSWGNTQEKPVTVEEVAAVEE